MAHNNSISDFAQDICTKTFCDSLDKVVPRTNYCVLLANLINLKSAYDSIKSYIMSSPVYKDPKNKQELDSYLSRLQQNISGIFNMCFANNKNSPKSKEELGVQNWICPRAQLNITGANLFLTNIALSINEFRDGDKTGSYIGAPIFDRIDLKPIYKTPDIDAQKVISVINPGSEEEVLFTIFPPRIHQGEICNPDVGFWSVNTTSNETTKNNNYDIASNGKNCDQYMEVCDFSYSHSLLLSGKGEEGQMWKSNASSGLPGLLKSYSSLGYCKDPAMYYSYQLPAHGKDNCSDTFTFVTPKASLPQFFCTYY